jgi:uncharacterized protein (TIGR02145 family)
MTAFALEQDTAFVPFRVNVDAQVTAKLDGHIISSIDVEADKVDTLKIPLGKTSNVNYRASQKTANRVPVITGNNRGGISLNLPSQIYRNAEISLYSVKGKSVLRAAADAAQTNRNISRNNLAAGVYLLSVKDINGQSFSSRLTHRGGSFNMNVVFDARESFIAGTPIMAAEALSEYGEWTITVSAERHIDSSYKFTPVAGKSNSVQNITLRIDGCYFGTFNPDVNYGFFIDTRNDQTYRTVVIGEQTWFAENLNFAGTDEITIGVCYNNAPDSCAKYGRLYSWAEAMGLPLSCNSSSCGSLVQSPHQGICPVGWRVPNEADWEVLISGAAGGGWELVSSMVWWRNAGTALKSQCGWPTGSGILHQPPGTNQLGFSAVPSGSFRFWEFGGNIDGEFEGIGYFSNWWSASVVSASGARGIEVYWSDAARYFIGGDRKMHHFSVRCVKNESQ